MVVLAVGPSRTCPEVNAAVQKACPESSGATYKKEETQYEAKLQTRDPSDDGPRPTKSDGPGVRTLSVGRSCPPYPWTMVSTNPGTTLG
jgi:hypothetical protein